MFGVHERRYEQIMGIMVLSLLLTMGLALVLGLMFQVKTPAILCILAAIFLPGIGCLTSTILVIRKQEQRLEDAAECVNAFLNGNTQIRLESSEEGSIGKFFEEINHMALSLQTHLDREKDSKEFLKSTISDISHQLKTPIAAIRMYNEIIQDEKDKPEVVADFTLKTTRSLDRMECLIQNLLKITKLDAKTIVLDKKDFAVKPLLCEIEDEFFTVAKREDKTITIQPMTEDLLLCADYNWTAECIRNLVQNALNHMHAGDTVELSCTRTPVFVRIMVRDNGDGIHPEDLHHIFKRFYRSRFSQDTQGVGLGLALVKAIVEAHGGTAGVESTFGEGSTFTLDFPAALL